MRRGLAIALGRASVLLMGVAFAPNAQAAPLLLRVGGEGSCPAPAQVVTVLKRLLTRTQVTAVSGPLAPEDVSLVDQGSQFRVAVAGQERSFVDATRGCDERAQHAAVFVALVVDPPMIAEPPAEPSPPPAPVLPVVEAPRPPPKSGTNAWQWDLTLGALVLVAPAIPDRRTAVASGAAAWIRGKRGFHLAFGAGLLRGALHLDDADASAWWIPLDFAAGFTVKTGISEISAEIGPNASILSIVGENLQQAHRQVRLEVGGRGTVAARFWLNQKFALFLSADAVLRPVPYALQINPDGEIGHTPTIWLGGSVGLSAALE